MKSRATTLTALVFLAGLSGAAQTPPEPAKTVVGPGGFEMTTYYVGFLYRGPRWTPEQTPETEAIQKGHMANIQKMADAGKLLVAGPFTDNGDLRGLFVFKVATLEEARALAAADPAVQAGRLRLEFHPWFAAKNIKVTAQAEPPAAAR